MKQILSKEELLKILDVKSWNSVRTYLMRPEFQHIKRSRIKEQGKWISSIYENITKKDIDTLKSLLHRNRGVNYCKKIIP